MKYQIAVMTILAVLVVSSCSTVTRYSSHNDKFTLKAAYLHYRPNPVHVGDRVVFDYAVKNDGTNTIKGGSYLVDLYLDDRDISFDHATSDIQPSRFINYSMAHGYYDWQPTSSGRFHYRLVVSERHANRGGSKTNSILEGYIDVKSPNTSLKPTK